MQMNYSASSVSQGRINQAKAEEQPNTFASENGVSSVTQMSSLDKPKQRMAGQLGHRALEYLNEPAEQQRTDNWMALFGQSNEGMEFNQAKINGGLPAV